MARIIKIDASHPETAFSCCKMILGSGGVVAYPTDTFYGLGVDPKNPEAVRKLFSIKARPAGQPILLLISDPVEVHKWAQRISPHAERLMRQFWPGPLTLVFAANDNVLPELTAGTGTIGLRVPGNNLTRQLLGYLGNALTGTSANISGKKSPDTTEDVTKTLGEKIDLVLDGGRTAGGNPSTIVDVTGKTLSIIREGAIPSHSIKQHL